MSYGTSIPTELGVISLPSFSQGLSVVGASQSIRVGRSFGTLSKGCAEPDCLQTMLLSAFTRIMAPGLHPRSSICCGTIGRMEHCPCRCRFDNKIGTHSECGWTSLFGHLRLSVGSWPTSRIFADLVKLHVSMGKRVLVVPFVA